MSSSRLWRGVGSPILIATLIVLVASSLSCRPRNKKAKGDEKIEEAAIAVRVERPSLRKMEEVIEVHGNLEPTEQVDVVTEVSGTVVEVLAEEGDMVKQGDLLARIDDDEYQISLRQAKAAYRVAEFDYKSTKTLYDEGMKSRSEFEKMRRSYLDSKANLETYQLRVANTRIEAPIEGMVVARNIEPYHQANAMEVLFTVADLSSYEITITVTEAEVAKLRLGQQVRVRVDALADDHDSFGLVATVRRIQPRVDPTTGSVQVEIELPDPGPGARMGMFTRLRIVTAVHENAMVIPRRALSTENENSVWVADDGKPKQAKVRTGLVDRLGIEILEGLDRDSMVIVEGHAALTEKSKINVVNQSELETKDSPGSETK